MNAGRIDVELGTFPPAKASAWETVRAGGGGEGLGSGRGIRGLGRRHTVYHVRRLSKGNWLTVKLDQGAWRWRRYGNPQGRAGGTVYAEGTETTWQAARSAADAETIAAWYAAGCPEVLS